MRAWGCSCGTFSSWRRRRRRRRAAPQRRGSCEMTQLPRGGSDPSASIGAPPQAGVRYPGAGRPLLPGGRRRDRGLRNLPCTPAPRDAQRPDRLRQDAFRRAHGLASGRPLVTVACHDDLSANDLTGRYLIRGSDTVWLDGPLRSRRGSARSATSTRSSRHGPTRSWSFIRLPTIGGSFRWTSGRVARGRSRVSDGRLLQSRVSARAQGFEAEHPTAVRGAGVRISRRRRWNPTIVAHEGHVDGPTAARW